MEKIEPKNGQVKKKEERKKIKIFAALPNLFGICKFNCMPEGNLKLTLKF